MFDTEVLEGRAILVLDAPPELSSRAALLCALHDHLPVTTADAIEDVCFREAARNGKDEVKVQVSPCRNNNNNTVVVCNSGSASNEASNLGSMMPTAQLPSSASPSSSATITTITTTTTTTSSSNTHASAAAPRHETIAPSQTQMQEDSALCAGEEVAAILFRTTEAVQTVMALVRVVSRGVAYALELRRGHLALGAHRVLVEGVLRLPSKSYGVPKTDADHRSDRTGAVVSDTHGGNTACHVTEQEPVREDAVHENGASRCRDDEHNKNMDDNTSSLHVTTATTTTTRSASNATHTSSFVANLCHAVTKANNHTPAPACDTHSSGVHSNSNDVHHTMTHHTDSRLDDPTMAETPCGTKPHATLCSDISQTHTRFSDSSPMCDVMLPPSSPASAPPIAACNSVAVCDSPSLPFSSPVSLLSSAATPVLFVTLVQLAKRNPCDGAVSDAKMCSSPHARQRTSWAPPAVPTATSAASFSPSVSAPVTRARGGEMGEFTVTPYVVYQILRGECLPRRIVVLPQPRRQDHGRADSNNNNNNNKNRCSNHKNQLRPIHNAHPSLVTTRALVQVSSLAEAEHVVRVLNDISVELSSAVAQQRSLLCPSASAWHEAVPTMGGNHNRDSSNNSNTLTLMQPCMEVRFHLRVRFRGTGSHATAGTGATAWRATSLQSISHPTQPAAPSCSLSSPTSAPDELHVAHNNAHALALNAHTASHIGRIFPRWWGQQGASLAAHANSSADSGAVTTTRTSMASPTVMHDARRDTIAHTTSTASSARSGTALAASLHDPAWQHSPTQQPPRRTHDASPPIPSDTSPALPLQPTPQSPAIPTAALLSLLSALPHTNSAARARAVSHRKRHRRSRSSGGDRSSSNRSSSESRGTSNSGSTESTSVCRRSRSKESQEINRHGSRAHHHRRDCHDRHHGHRHHTRRSSHSQLHHHPRTVTHASHARSRESGRSARPADSALPLQEERSVRQSHLSNVAGRGGLLGAGGGRAEAEMVHDTAAIDMYALGHAGLPVASAPLHAGGERLPPHWRSIYSLEYQQMYYVYRDPVTGMESTTWYCPTS